MERLACFGAGGFGQVVPKLTEPTELKIPPGAPKDRQIKGDAFVPGSFQRELRRSADTIEQLCRTLSGRQYLGGAAANALVGAVQAFGDQAMALRLNWPTASWAKLDAAEDQLIDAEARAYETIRRRAEKDRPYASEALDGLANRRVQALVDAVLALSPLVEVKPPG